MEQRKRENLLVKHLHGKRKQTADDDKKFLPDIITTNILIRLPARCVVRFMSVCKSWFSLIHSSHFLDSKKQNYPFSSSFILVPNPFHHRLHLLEDEHCGVVKSSKLNLSFSHDLGLLYPVGFSNGLLCLSSYPDFLAKSIERVYWDTDISMYIINPITNEYVALPDATMPPVMSPIHVLQGFGFLPTTKEFKVVVILLHVEKWPEIRIFTLGSDSWRRVNLPTAFISSRKFCGGVFLNDSVHWLPGGEDERYPDNEYGIVSFDLKHETLGLIPLPGFYFTTLWQEFQLGVLAGCLCLSHYCATGIYGNGYYEMWVIIDYNAKKSWTKQFVVDMDGIYINMFVSPVTLLKNGDLVLIFDCTLLVSYNFETGNFTQLEDDTIPKCKPNHGVSYRAIPYVWTFISPFQAGNNLNAPSKENSCSLC